MVNFVESDHNLCQKQLCQYIYPNSQRMSQKLPISFVTVWLSACNNFVTVQWVFLKFCIDTLHESM